MSSIKLRDHELTAINNREKLDFVPTFKSKELSESHAKDWLSYREQYDAASNLDLVTDFPLQIDIELNSSCNLKCPMCPISAEADIKKGPDTWYKKEVFFEWLPFAVAQGLKALKLNYINEPLIRSDLVDFIRKAKELGVLDVYFNTNGLLLSEDLMRQFIELGLNRIQISIDAMTEQTYQKVRPGGRYKIVHDNVLKFMQLKRQFKSEYPSIRVNFVKTELNAHELQDFLSYWQQKVDMIGVQEFIVPPKSSQKELRGANKEINQKNGFRCAFPYKQLVINNENQILPCCTFWGETMPLGQYTGPESLKQAWHSDQMKELRRIHKDGEYFRNPACKSCIENSRDSFEMAAPL